MHGAVVTLFASSSSTDALNCTCLSLRKVSQLLYFVKLPKKRRKEKIHLSLQPPESVSSPRQGTCVRELQQRSEGTECENHKPLAQVNCSQTGMFWLGLCVPKVCPALLKTAEAGEDATGLP